MKPRLRAEELTGMISLLRDKFVRSENLRRCCFVPMRIWSRFGAGPAGYNIDTQIKYRPINSPTVVSATCRP